MPGQIYSLKGQVSSFSPRFLLNLSPQCVRLGAAPFPGARVTGTHRHAGFLHSCRDRSTDPHDRATGMD